MVDLVETGTTMRAAGLEIVSTILSTEAVLLSNPNTKKQALVDMIASRIDGYMTAKRYVVCMCVWLSHPALLYLPYRVAHLLL